MDGVVGRTGGLKKTWWCHRCALDSTRDGLAWNADPPALFSECTRHSSALSLACSELGLRLLELRLGVLALLAQAALTPLLLLALLALLLLLLLLLALLLFGVVLRFPFPQVVAPGLARRTP